jgi:hypothetical protein
VYPVRYLTEGAISNDYPKTPKTGSTVAKNPMKVLSKSWFEVRVQSRRSATTPKDIYDPIAEPHSL